VKTSGRQGRDGDDERGVGPARSSRRPRFHQRGIAQLAGCADLARPDKEPKAQSD
jgi:hypothetical protein